MRFSLSTNWCNRRLESGEEIADIAYDLGFRELELGFHTTEFQVAGIRSRLDRIPVGSVHAFCPVPISAPQGYPELYQLADFNEDMRALARVHVVRNIEFAASVGADTVVLHAGRVMCRTLLKRWRDRKRVRRGAKLVPLLRGELDRLLPVLEKHGVTLALENLPYFEGFPDEAELKAVLDGGYGDRVRAWYDTGHGYVRQDRGWTRCELPPEAFAGMHINDSEGGDDHLAPGTGKVDFAALKPIAEKARHIVFEPNEGVTEAELRAGIAKLEEEWK